MSTFTNEVAVEGEDFCIREWGPKKAVRYACKHCKWDTHEKSLIYDHYYWRHYMKAITDSKGNVKFVQRERHSPSAVLYGADNTLITEIQGPEVEEL